MGGGGVGGEFTRPTSTGQRSQGQIQTTVLGDGSYTEVTPAEFTNALGRDSISTPPSQIQATVLGDGSYTSRVYKRVGQRQCQYTPPPNPSHPPQTPRPLQSNTGDGTEVTPAEFTNALGRDSVSTRPSQIRVSRARYRRREKRCWSVGEGSARPFAPLATPGCPARAPSSTLPAETGVGEWTAEAGPCT